MGKTKRKNVFLLPYGETLVMVVNLIAQKVLAEINFVCFVIQKMGKRNIPLEVDLMDKILIEKTPNADTRMGKSVTKTQLENDTRAHIAHVIAVGEAFCNELNKRLAEHDHTKLEYIDEFTHDFNGQSDETPFKTMDWWKKHEEERHHLKDRVPANVDLWDFCEFIIDSTVAAAARSGVLDFEKYLMDLPLEVYKLITENTMKFLFSKLQIKEKNE